MFIHSCSAVLSVDVRVDLHCAIGPHTPPLRPVAAVQGPSVDHVHLSHRFSPPTAPQIRQWLESLACTTGASVLTCPRTGALLAECSDHCGAVCAAVYLDALAMSMLHMTDYRLVWSDVPAWAESVRAAASASASKCSPAPPVFEFPRFHYGISLWMLDGLSRAGAPHSPRSQATRMGRCLPPCARSADSR